jgi:hypothetical protein
MLEAVTGLAALVAPDRAITVDDDKEETETQLEPSILGVLNKDLGVCCILVYIGVFCFLHSSCGFDV